MLSKRLAVAVLIMVVAIATIYVDATYGIIKEQQQTIDEQDAKIEKLMESIAQKEEEEQRIFDNYDSVTYYKDGSKEYTKTSEPYGPFGMFTDKTSVYE